MHTIISIDFYKELRKILFKKKVFFLKFKMAIIEITKSEIAFKWLKNYKVKNNEDIIFYSFWSSFYFDFFGKDKKNKKKLKRSQEYLVVIKWVYKK